MIGRMIDSYKILEVLGRGGMGVVYRATDTTLDRDVALKMMDVLIASDPNFLKRFQSEAKALAKLQNRTSSAFSPCGRRNSASASSWSSSRGGRWRTC
jgi:serine/threonine protein kinase